MNICDLMGGVRDYEEKMKSLNPNANQFDLWRDLAGKVKDKALDFDLKEVHVPPFLFHGSGMFEYTCAMTLLKEVGVNVIEEVV